MPFDLNDWEIASTDDTTATKAQTAAGVAQSTADTAQDAADAAQSTADTAQSTADTAKKDAATAQSTADSAITDALNAQSTADTAITNAATAQSTADTALTNAADAAKTATNYLSYDETDGLVVGNQTEGSLEGNVQIGVDTDGDPFVALRDGDQVLANFTDDSLTLSGKKYGSYASVTAYKDGKGSGWGIFGGSVRTKYESSLSGFTTGLQTFTTDAGGQIGYALLHTQTDTNNDCAAIELFNIEGKQGLNVFCGDYHGKLAFFPAGSVYIATNDTSPVDIFQGQFTQITPTTTAKVTTPLARAQKTITTNTGACTANWLRAYTMGGMCFVTGQVTPTSAGTDKMLLYISGVEPMYQTYFPIAAYGHGGSEGYVKKVNSGQSHIYFNIPETGDWKFNFAFATTTSTEEQSFSITSDLKFWESNGWVATDDPLETT